MWVPLLPQHVLLKVWVSLEIPNTLPTTVYCRTDMINQLLTEFWGVELSLLVLFTVRRGAALTRVAMGSFDPTHQTVSMRAGRIERSKKQVPQGTVEILQTSLLLLTPHVWRSPPWCSRSGEVTLLYAFSRTCALPSQYVYLKCN